MVRGRKRYIVTGALGLLLIVVTAANRDDGATAPRLRVEVTSKPEGKVGFDPLPKRRVVEPTFGCLSRWRRLVATSSGCR